MHPQLPLRPAKNLRRRRRQLKRYFPSHRLATRIEAIPNLGLVYVRNPKVATSTLLEWLDWMNTGRLRPPNDNVRRSNSLPQPRDVGWEKVMLMLDGQAFRFSFVRNPLARFESAYRSKIQAPTRERAQILEELERSDDTNAEVSFEDFLGAVERQEPLHMNIHWRHQHLNLMHPLLTFDHLGRLETFDRDIEVIQKRLGLPNPPMRARNASLPGLPSVYEDRPDLVERVRAIFARDIELYGY